MPNIATLDDIEVGTDVALDTGNGTHQRWTRTENGFTSTTGTELEDWFFTGWVEQGRMFLRDYTPPVVGEWFSDPARRLWFLVGVVDGTKSWTVMYREDRFQGISTRENLQEDHRRCDPPEWVGQTQSVLTSMAIKLCTLEYQVLTLNERVRQDGYLKRDLSLASQYLSAARRRLGEES